MLCAFFVAEYCCSSPLCFCNVPCCVVPCLCAPLTPGESHMAQSIISAVSKMSLMYSTLVQVPPDNEALALLHHNDLQYIADHLLMAPFLFDPELKHLLGSCLWFGAEALQLRSAARTVLTQLVRGAGGPLGAVMGSGLWCVGYGCTGGMDQGRGCLTDRAGACLMMTAVPAMSCSWVWQHTLLNPCIGWAWCMSSTAVAACTCRQCVVCCCAVLCAAAECPEVQPACRDAAAAGPVPGPVLIRWQQQGCLQAG